jgi:uncharacterized protein
MTRQATRLARVGETGNVFLPAWWLPGPHLQTVGARWSRPSSGVTLRRERLTLPDGDFVDLDWTADPAPADGPPAPLVLVLHGLEGSARSGYALELYRQLRGRGVAAVGLNFRSCSGELNRGRRLYHSGETEDTRFVLRALRDRFPRRPLGAVGSSLGGNVLVKYLGEASTRASGDTPVTAAAAVSVPYDLAAGARHMEHGMARLYVWRLLRSLQRKVRLRAADLGDLVDVPRALRATTFHAFDDAATAPLHGFQGADDYYARSSSAPWVPHVRVPTLLVHADDDPFLPADAVPRAAAAANPRIRAAFTRRGGHVGFVAGPPWRRAFWAESQAASFLADHLRAQPLRSGWDHAG